MRGSADLQWLSPHGPIRVGVLIAEGEIAQVVDVRVKVPVAGDVVERVILQGQVDNVLDLRLSDVSPSSFSWEYFLTFLRSWLQMEGLSVGWAIAVMTRPKRAMKVQIDFMFGSVCRWRGG